MGGGPAFSMPNISKEEGNHHQGPKKRGPKCKKEVKPEGGSVCIESKLAQTKPEKKEKGEKCEKGELNPEYILQMKSAGDDEDDDCLTLSQETHSKNLVEQASSLVTEMKIVSNS